MERHGGPRTPVGSAPAERGPQRSLPEWLDPVDLVWVTVLWGAFLVVVQPHIGFFMDDAFITFRFAEHWAQGHGIVWNPGGDPVEGVTSFLWLAILAAGAWLGLDLPTLSKTLGLFAALLCISLVYLAGRRWGVCRWALVPATAVLAVSPPFAVNSLQGMETPLAALLGLVAGVAAIHALEDDGWGSLALASLALLLAALARPEMVLFSGVLLVVLAWQLARRRGAQVLIPGAGVVTGVLVLPGASYFAWRWWYFGYPFPNTYYIKWAGAAGEASAGYVTTLVFVLLAPLLVVTLLQLSGVDEAEARQRAGRVAAPAAAAGVFLLATLQITPIQGYMWRFQMPVVPLLILCLALLLRELPGLPGYHERPACSRALAVSLLAVTLVLVPYGATQGEADRHAVDHTWDRRSVGMALAPFAAHGYNLFTTEAGALPYHSGWPTLDRAGLTNETIAHEGISPALLEDFWPHLVMFRQRMELDMMQRKDHVMAHHVETHGYHLVAAIHKSGSPGAFHFYLLDPEVDDYEDLVCAILTAEGVVPTDPEPFLALMGTQIEASPIGLKECGQTLPEDLVDQQTY